MKVGVLCEVSGRVRDAFLKRGHDAISCDLLPTESPGPHRLGMVQHFDWAGFDLLISFPTCTDLCSSGARWWKYKSDQQKLALEFVRYLMAMPVKRKALENPVGKISTSIRKPDQIIQPYQFGHGETKATCLWLDGLPKLKPTKIVEGRESRIHRMPQSPERSRKRSVTYQGVADAMAEQWGSV